MPKVSITCQQCQQVFERYPAFIRHAQNRGSEIKFCSRACTDAARSAGIIGTKRRRGETLTCEVCQASFYRKPSAVALGRCRFCSKACQIAADKTGIMNRSYERPAGKRGKTITCQACGTTVYRKLSELTRNVGKTCGAATCMSAYGRSLWGLAPVCEELAKQPRAARKANRQGMNFTSAQRAAWIGTECARCGTTDNLTLDHILAVCCGGKPTRDNAQTLCGACNNWKAKHIDRPLARQQSRSGGLQS